MRTFERDRDAKGVMPRVMMRAVAAPGAMERPSILMVHNRYRIRAGEDESQESEARMLVKHGCIVDSYLFDNKLLDERSRLPLAINAVWSTGAYRGVAAMLGRKHYDIVHVQNFFPLISPSVIYAARAKGVPVVHSLRNYRLVCPSGTLFREGRICEICTRKAVPWPGAVHACYRGNHGASTVAATMLAVHNALGTWRKGVALYVALSEFARAKFVQSGFSSERIAIKPNFVDPDPGVGNGRGNFAVYVGRLSAEKGVHTMLAAWAELGQILPLKVVGDGPLRGAVMAMANSIKGVQFLGARTKDEVLQMMGEAALVIVPSEWYEPFGRVVIEAYSKGTPVVAATSGGLTELVSEGQTGFMFQPGNAEQLAVAIRSALSDPERLLRMRHAARQEFCKKYTASANLRMLLAIYSKARGYAPAQNSIGV
jgi:glycosyltransferase involved in cell wall biosynthesis